VEPDFIPQPAVTPDGVTCQVLLNLSDPVEAPTVALLGADGVGLFRTEFYYMGCANWPTAEESYQVYRQVASELGDLPLHIRLVDFGADKFPPYAEFPFSRNPSLGLRGIRLLLAREDILRPQVQALARLGRERELTVLIPMLDSLDTLHETTRRLCQICGCSERSQLPFRLGAMIEVPLAALQIRQILPHVDAVSIGLNDLTQYLLAADRDDTFVERYHDAMQPAVLRLVAEVITAAREAFCPVTVCGELAGDPKLTGLLLALGLRSFSVSRASYKAVLDAICHLSIRGVREFADRLPELATAGEVREWVQRNLLPPTP
jgi:phosphotransferase system enzyme I (PtsI)